MLNEIVSSSIRIGKRKMQGEEVNEKTSFGGMILRFFISFIWFIITFFVSLAAFYAMAGQGVSDMFGGESKGLGIFAIIASGLIFVITFCIPYLRKKGTLTRWCGIVSLGDAIWWIYLMAT